MKARNVPEHHIRGVCGTLSLTMDEMNHTRSSVGNRKDGVEILAISRHLVESEDSVHTYRLPFPRDKG